MAKYKITLRREKAEIAISITEIETNSIVYKNGFFGSVEYYRQKEFKELSDKFLEYVNESTIEFRNHDRYFNMLSRLLMDNVLDFDHIRIDDELNIVTINGGLK